MLQTELRRDRGRARRVDVQRRGEVGGRWRTLVVLVVRGENGNRWRRREDLIYQCELAELVKEVNSPFLESERENP
jgi:hypothetical protein